MFSELLGSMVLCVTNFSQYCFKYLFCPFILSSPLVISLCICYISCSCLIVLRYYALFLSCLAYFAFLAFENFIDISSCPEILFSVIFSLTISPSKAFLVSFTVFCIYPHFSLIYSFLEMLAFCLHCPSVLLH